MPLSGEGESARAGAAGATIHRTMEPMLAADSITHNGWRIAGIAVILAVAYRIPRGGSGPRWDMFDAKSRRKIRKVTDEFHDRSPQDPDEPV